MIREILETEWKLKINNTGASDYAEQIFEIWFTKNNQEYKRELFVCYYGNFEDYHIENACKEYVRKYGFKLKWFNDRLQYMIKRKNKENFRDLLGSTGILDEDMKLIAWLYANDIEIIDEQT